MSAITPTTENRTTRRKPCPSEAVKCYRSHMGTAALAPRTLQLQFKIQCGPHSEQIAFPLYNRTTLMTVQGTIRWGKFSQKHNHEAAFLTELTSPYSLNTQRGRHTSNPYGEMTIGWSENHVKQKHCINRMYSFQISNLVIRAVSTGLWRITGIGVIKGKLALQSL